MTTSTVTVCQPNAANQYATTEFLSYCLPVYDTLPEDVKTNWDSLTNSVMGSSFGGMFADLMTAKWVLLISVAIAVLVTVIYIALMHYCAFWLSWISVGLIQVALIAIGYFSFSYRRSEIEADEAYAEESMATWLNWITWLSWIFAGIYYIVIICNFYSLRVAVAVIQTTASFVADSKKLMFIPLLYFGVALVTSVLFICGLVCVSSIGEITVDSYET